MGLIHSIKTRGLLWAALYSILFVFDRWVEFGLYPQAILTFGIVRGIGVMIVFSLVVCWLLLVFYDWVATIDASKIRSRFLRKLTIAASDALGFETLKEVGNDFYTRISTPIELTPGTSWWARLKNDFLCDLETIRKWLVFPIANKAFKPVLYLYTSLMHNGMTCLILMRPAHCHRMGSKEWAIFVSSVIISCLGWGALVSGVMAYLHHAFPWLYDLIVQIVNFIT